MGKWIELLLIFFIVLGMLTAYFTSYRLSLINTKVDIQEIADGIRYAKDQTNSLLTAIRHYADINNAHDLPFDGQSTFAQVIELLRSTHTRFTDYDIEMASSNEFPRGLSDVISKNIEEQLIAVLVLRTYFEKYYALTRRSQKQH